jgi:hypothetical protein
MAEREDRDDAVVSVTVRATHMVANLHLPIGRPGTRPVEDPKFRRKNFPGEPLVPARSRDSFAADAGSLNCVRVIIVVCNEDRIDLGGRDRRTDTCLLAALAMISAYVVAGELANAGGRHQEAFGKYEAVLRAYIHTKQKGAERFAAVFAPKTRWGQRLRNQVITAFAIPGVARLAVGGDVVDTLQLPDYPWLSHYEFAA